MDKEKLTPIEILKDSNLVTLISEMEQILNRLRLQYNGDPLECRKRIREDKEYIAKFEEIKTELSKAPSGVAIDINSLK